MTSLRFGDANLAIVSKREVRSYADGRPIALLARTCTRSSSVPALLPLDEGTRLGASFRPAARY
jgi:hypothetical protein